MSYFWKTNGSLASVLGPDFQIPILTLAQNGVTISVTLSNKFGIVESSNAVLTVLPALSSAVAPEGIGTDSINLRGTVTAGSLPTVAWFEWGATTNYGKQSAPLSLPSGFNPVTLSEIVTGFQAGRYAFRLVSSNAFGTSASSNITFYSAPINATMDSGANVSAFDTTWYETGYNQNAPETGFPKAGSTLVSESQPDHKYKLPPNYGERNAILIDEEHPAATISLSLPGSFSRLSFLTSAGRGSVKVSVILHHSDGSIESGAFVSNDWFDPSNVVTRAKGRVSLPGRLGNPLSGPWGFDAVRSGNPRIYARDIPVSNRSTDITTIDLNWQSGSGHAAVFAISGDSGEGFSPLLFEGLTHDIIVESEYSGRTILENASLSDSFVAEFIQLPGFIYEIQTSSTLNPEAWTSLEVSISETRKRASLRNKVDPRSGNRFYRIKVE